MSARCGVLAWTLAWLAIAPILVAPLSAGAGSTDPGAGPEAVESPDDPAQPREGGPGTPLQGEGETREGPKAPRPAGPPAGSDPLDPFRREPSQRARTLFDAFAIERVLDASIPANAPPDTARAVVDAAAAVRQESLNASPADEATRAWLDRLEAWHVGDELARLVEQGPPAPHASTLGGTDPGPTATEVAVGLADLDDVDEPQASIATNLEELPAGVRGPVLELLDTWLRTQDTLARGDPDPAEVASMARQLRNATRDLQKPASGTPPGDPTRDSGSVFDYEWCPDTVYYCIPHVLIIDLYGDDTYRPAPVTIDLQGDDTYTGPAATCPEGACVLADLDGDDEYVPSDDPDLACCLAVSGAGVAVLHDRAGDDRYRIPASLTPTRLNNDLLEADPRNVVWNRQLPLRAPNVAFSTAGRALFEDVRGDDAYENGRGYGRLGGLFLDLAGDDAYEDVEGLGTLGGVFLDRRGDDTYEATAGLGSGSIADVGRLPGLFVEGAGNDTYVAESGWQAQQGANGVFLELGGGDTYRFRSGGAASGLLDIGSAAQGAAGSGGFGLFVEARGHDTYRYEGGFAAAQGATTGGGSAAMFEVAGHDTYVSPAGVARGTGDGVFLDLGGHDRYEDPNGPAWAQRRFSQGIAQWETGADAPVIQFDEDLLIRRVRIEGFSDGVLAPDREVRVRGEVVNGGNETVDDVDVSFRVGCPSSEAACRSVDRTVASNLTLDPGQRVLVEDAWSTPSGEDRRRRVGFEVRSPSEDRRPDNDLRWRTVRIDRVVDLAVTDVQLAGNVVPANVSLPLTATVENRGTVKPSSAELEVRLVREDDGHVVNVRPERIDPPAAGGGSLAPAREIEIEWPMEWYDLSNRTTYRIEARLHPPDDVDASNAEAHAPFVYGQPRRYLLETFEPADMNDVEGACGTNASCGPWSQWDWWHGDTSEAILPHDDGRHGHVYGWNLPGPWEGDSPGGTLSLDPNSLNLSDAVAPELRFWSYVGNPGDVPPEAMETASERPVVDWEDTESTEINWAHPFSKERDAAGLGRGWQAHVVPLDGWFDSNRDGLDLRFRPPSGGDLRWAVDRVEVRTQGAPNARVELVTPAPGLRPDPAAPGSSITVRARIVAEGLLPDEPVPAEIQLLGAHGSRTYEEVDRVLELPRPGDASREIRLTVPVDLPEVDGREVCVHVRIDPPEIDASPLDDAAIGCLTVRTQRDLALVDAQPVVDRPSLHALADHPRRVNLTVENRGNVPETEVDWRLALNGTEVEGSTPTDLAPGELTTIPVGPVEPRRGGLPLVRADAWVGDDENRSNGRASLELPVYRRLDEGNITRDVQATGAWHAGPNATLAWGQGARYPASSSATAHLTPEPLELNPHREVALVLRHSYDLERDFDGGLLEARGSAGTWHPLPPTGGDPVAALGGRTGVTGDSHGTVESVFPLDRPGVGEVHTLLADGAEVDRTVGGADATPALESAVWEPEPGGRESPLAWTNHGYVPSHLGTVRPVNLTEVDGPVELVFWHHYVTGGAANLVVAARAPGDGHWMPLTPEGAQAPAFPAGNTPGWERVRVDLSGWTGQRVDLAFRVTAPAGSDGPGAQARWWIDDVAVRSVGAPEQPVDLRLRAGSDATRSQGDGWTVREVALLALPFQRNLAITNASLTPRAVEPGEDVHVAVTVTNAGRQRSPATNVTVEVDQGTDVDLPLSPLRPGETERLHANVTLHRDKDHLPAAGDASERHAGVRPEPFARETSGDAASTPPPSTDHTPDWMERWLGRLGPWYHWYAWNTLDNELDDARPEGPETARVDVRVEASGDEAARDDHRVLAATVLESAEIAFRDVRVTPDRVREPGEPVNVTANLDHLAPWSTSVWVDAELVAPDGTVVDSFTRSFLAEPGETLRVAHNLTPTVPGRQEVVVTATPGVRDRYEQTGPRRATVLVGADRAPEAFTFDAGTDGWTGRVGSPSAADLSDWRWTDAARAQPLTRTAPGAVTNTLPNETGYADGRSDRLVSPALDLTAVRSDATLRFAHRYAFHGDGSCTPSTEFTGAFPSPCYGPDHGRLEVSTDGGTTWEPVEPMPGAASVVGWRTCHDCTNGDVGADRQDVRQAYVGSSGGWVRQALPLSPYRGETVRFAFHFISDPKTEEGGPVEAATNDDGLERQLLFEERPARGWAVDDVRVSPPADLSLVPPDDTVTLPDGVTKRIPVTLATSGRHTEVARVAAGIRSPGENAGGSPTVELTNRDGEPVTRVLVGPERSARLWAEVTTPFLGRENALRTALEIEVTRRLDPTSTTRTSLGLEIEPTPRGDLRVVPDSVTTTEPTVGEPARVQFVVENAGRAPLPSTEVHVVHADTGERVANATVDPLDAPGNLAGTSRARVSVTVTPDRPGPLPLRVVPDPTDAVWEEQNEDTYDLTLHIAQPPRPDLDIEGARWIPNDGLPGSTIEVSLVNRGTGPTTGTDRVRLLVDNTTLAARPVPRLAVGEHARVGLSTDRDLEQRPSTIELSGPSTGPDENRWLLDTRGEPQPIEHDLGSVRVDPRGGGLLSLGGVCPSGEAEADSVHLEVGPPGTRVEVPAPTARDVAVTPPRDLAAGGHPLEGRLDCAGGETERVRWTATLRVEPDATSASSANAPAGVVNREGTSPSSVVEMTPLDDGRVSVANLADTPLRWEARLAGQPAGAAVDPAWGRLPAGEVTVLDVDPTALPTGTRGPASLVLEAGNATHVLLLDVPTPEPSPAAPSPGATLSRHVSSPLLGPGLLVLGLAAWLSRRHAP